LRQMRQELIWRGVEVIEKMERETGFEPATSSLGIPASAAQSLKYAATNFTAMDGERRREDDPSA
jgi:hypothetical protein